MRFRTNHVAPHGNLRESTTERPLLNRFDEPAAHTFSALSVRHNQSPDFAVPVHFQQLMFGAMNPAHHFRCFRDADDMLLALKKALEPLGHDARVDRITEFPA